MCQYVHDEGGLGQGIPQRAMGGFWGSKQVYLDFVESTPIAGLPGDGVSTSPETSIIARGYLLHD